MRMLAKLCFSLLILLFSASHVAAKDENRELVVLLHGIGQSGVNMTPVQLALENAGYKTLNMEYPSLKNDLEALSSYLAKELKKEDVWSGAYHQVHFTSHSMGGLVVRGYLEAHKKDIPQDQLGRVVMLAPPNGGSEVADLMKNFPPYLWIFGPAGQELATEEQKNIKTDVYYDLGIIAGNKDWPYLIAAHIIHGGSDGRVAVEKTKLVGMKDHVTLSATHSFISWKPSVHEQIIYFIKHGSFKREQ